MPLLSIRIIFMTLPKQFLSLNKGLWFYPFFYLILLFNNLLLNWRPKKINSYQLIIAWYISLANYVFLCMYTFLLILLVRIKFTLFINLNNLSDWLRLSFLIPLVILTINSTSHTTDTFFFVLVQKIDVMWLVFDFGRDDQNTEEKNVQYFELVSSQGLDFWVCYTHKKRKIHVEKATISRKYMVSEEIKFLSVSKYCIFTIFLKIKYVDTNAKLISKKNLNFRPVVVLSNLKNFRACYTHKKRPKSA